jgi:hypothetical protein
MVPASHQYQKRRWVGPAIPLTQKTIVLFLVQKTSDDPCATDRPARPQNQRAATLAGQTIASKQDKQYQNNHMRGRRDNHMGHLGVLQGRTGF